MQIPSISSIDRFRLELPEDDELRTKVAEVNQMQRNEDSLLGFLQDTTQAAIRSSEQVEAARRQDRSSNYPPSQLANKLQTIAELIDAGLRTSVYYVTLDGFDTHAQQADAHTGLLRQLSEATEAFMNHLTEAGHADRVAVLSFSEFGRRVKENASAGTDHGAAGPVFLAGGKIRPGVIGEHPSLSDLQDGDLRHKIDFRSVYAAILDEWLGSSSENVLGGKFARVKAFA